MARCLSVKIQNLRMALPSPRFQADPGPLSPFTLQRTVPKAHAKQPSPSNPNSRLHRCDETGSFQQEKPNGPSTPLTVPPGAWGPAEGTSISPHRPLCVRAKRFQNFTFLLPFSPSFLPTSPCPSSSLLISSPPPLVIPSLTAFAFSDRLKQKVFWFR